MRNKEIKQELEKELEKIDDSFIRGMLVRLGYEFLIEELIKKHPNPKVAFNDTIKKHPSFKIQITDLADTLELDLGADK